MPVDRHNKKGGWPTLGSGGIRAPIGLVTPVDSSVCFLLSRRPPESTSHPEDEGGVNQLMGSATVMTNAARIP